MGCGATGMYQHRQTEAHPETLPAASARHELMSRLDWASSFKVSLHLDWQSRCTPGRAYRMYTWIGKVSVHLEGQSRCTPGRA